MHKIPPDVGSYIRGYCYDPEIRKSEGTSSILPSNCRQNGQRGKRKQRNWGCKVKSSKRFALSCTTQAGEGHSQTARKKSCQDIGGVQIRKQKVKDGERTVAFFVIKRKEVRSKLKYQIMYRYRAEYPVTVMCRFFGISAAVIMILFTVQAGQRKIKNWPISLPGSVSDVGAPLMVIAGCGCG